MEKISVIGFGKIGQAVATNILKHDISVTAVDVNSNLVNLFVEKRFNTNEPGVKEVLVEGFNNGKLKITCDYGDVRNSLAVIVCIPLLVDETKKIIAEPFLNCFKNLANYLSDQCLVAIETSVPVGFSRNMILPLLEKNGKKHGVDFYLVHSPERIKSGTMLQQLAQVPKIIGGINEAAAKKGEEIYSGFFDRKLLRAVSSIETAEMIKLAGMVYRDINIAISNQLAQFSKKVGLDLTEIIQYSNTDGEAFLLNPGIGVGGHCAPVYPYFLIENFREQGLEFTLARHSRDINDSMAVFAINLISDNVRDKKALLLGLGFRPDVKEDTFSTAYLLARELKNRNFEVYLHDPYFSDEELQEKRFKPIQNIYSSPAEVIFLVTCHSAYRNMNWIKLKQNGCRFFVDGRNSFDKKLVESAGIKYFGIGR